MDITSVVISHDSRLLAARSLDSMTRVWDIATGHLLAWLKGHMNSVYSVAFSANGRELITGSLDKTLKYWDIMSIIQRVQQSPKTDRTAPEEPASLQSTIELVGNKVYYLHRMSRIAPLNATTRTSY